MASIAELMDFLLSLMREDDTRREFERDPDAALATRGLADVSDQDVRDARLMMADCGSVQPRADRPDRGGSGNSGGDDRIREINHTTTHFEVGDVTTTVITVNDNDTVIVDSFNNDVVAIQDNDTTDVDVISIVDNDDEDDPEGEQGEEDELDASAGAADPAGELGAGGELPGGSGSVAEPGFGADSDAGAGAGAPEGFGSVVGPGFAPPEGRPDFGLPEGFRGDEPAEVDSGVGEGFAPEEDSGFGVQPELGAGAGFTDEAPVDEFDELVG